VSGRIIDDRGQSVERHPGAEMVSNITGRQVSDLERAAALAANLLPVLALGGVVAYVVVVGGARDAYRVVGASICPGVLVFIVALGLRGLILRTVRPLAGLQLSLPTMMAHGYCGACGYRLTESRRDKDGCTTCPECGAAWHADRVSFPQAQPAQTVAALRSAARASAGGAGRLQITVAIGYLDDRRVGLPAPYCWPRGVFTSSVPPHAGEAKQALNRRLGLGIYIVLAGVWVGGAALATVFWRNEVTMSARAGPIAFIAALCGLLHVLVRMAKLPADEVRGVVLQRRLCPSCWSPLEGRAEFDGCTACPNCRAAWRATDRGMPAAGEGPG
jgi:uncharacterized Zn finger protein (UPF0148 family)